MYFTNMKYTVTMCKAPDEVQGTLGWKREDLKPYHLAREKTIKNKTNHQSYLYVQFPKYNMASARIRA